MSLDQAPGTGGPRWLRGVLWSLLIAAGVYTLVRAVTLSVDTYDSHVYLYNASRLLGSPLAPLDDSRPWLLSVLHMPSVALARLFGPANVWLLRAPHLLNAAISLGAVAALIWLMRMVFPWWAALLGGVLFVANRCYVHYAANVLTDLGVTALCTLALALHLHGVKTRRARWFVLAGVTFGAAIGMKFTAPTFAITIAAVELGALVVFEPAPGRRFGRPRFRWDGRRAKWVAAEAAAVVATFVAIQVFVFTKLYGGLAWRRFQDAWSAAQKLRHTRYPGELWSDNVPMALTTMSAALLILCGLGLLVAARRPRRDDLPFAAGLAGVGGSMLFAIGHSEARYLLPVVPCVIYFALRAAEGAAALWERTRAGGARVLAGSAVAGVGLLVAGTVANGLAQVAEDHDPFFQKAFQGRAARALVAARPPGRPAFIMGYWHTLSPRLVGPVPQDEFWNTYHSSPFVFEYLFGEPFTLLPAHAGQYDAALDLLAHTVDGDALIRFDGVFYMTAGFPATPRAQQGFEVWKIHRKELPVENGRAIFPAGLSSEPWIMFWKTPEGAWSFFGLSTAKSGEPILMPPAAASTGAVTLLKIDIQRFD
jgi:hypothetical protein